MRILYADFDNSGQLLLVWSWLLELVFWRWPLMLLIFFMIFKASRNVLLRHVRVIYVNCYSLHHLSSPRIKFVLGKQSCIFQFFVPIDGHNVWFPHWVLECFPLSHTQQLLCLLYILLDSDCSSQSLLFNPTCAIEGPWITVCKADSYAALEGFY